MLSGEKLTHDEVDWSGTDPAAPTSDGRLRTILRGEVLRTWVLSFGLTAVLLCAETYVMMRNVTIFIHGETPTVLAHPRPRARADHDHAAACSRRGRDHQPSARAHEAQGEADDRRADAGLADVGVLIGLLRT